MKKRFWVFLSILLSLVISHTGWGNHVKKTNPFNSQSSAFLKNGGPHHYCAINDPDRRLNTDKFKIRTKANTDSWEVCLPTCWHYNALVFFPDSKHYHSKYERDVSSAHLLTTALRGPPAAAII